MATNTILQCLNDGSDFGVTTSARRQVEVFLASATVAEKDAVSLDMSKTADGDKALYVLKADTDTVTATAFVGVVLKSAEPDGALTAGSRVFVVTAGPVEATVNTATSQGDRLSIGSTGGQLDVVPDVNEGGAATIPLRSIAAIACEDDTAGVATVLVYKQFV